LFQSAVIQEMESLKSLSKPLLFHRTDPSDITPSYLQFGDVLERWRQAFPEGTRIDARVYERSRLENGNVVTDFVGSLGLEQDEEFCLQDSRVNHSLDARAAALLLLANAAGAPYEGLLRLSKALSTVSGRARGTKRFLTTAEIEQLQSHYEADNRKLFADFIISGEGFGNPEATAPESSDVAPAGAEELAYYASIYDTLIAPPRELWLGELLTSRPLARIAGAPNAGWRGPEQDGVWSVGSESRLAFQLPQTHAESGPSHLLLTVAGHYTPGNTSTRIRTHQWEMDLSLENAELEIAIDDRVRSEGVEVQLLHHNPQSPDGWQDDPDHGLAFKLQFLRYNFAWNADSPA
ncbi:MAG: hypothetical protein R3228_16925, partial [Halioglobus sp.]|nr:hypothetical protein [Halioglobus sp.]